MSKVTIYTTRFCPYCLMAKRLLVSKGIAFNEIPVDRRPDLREEMRLRTHGRTSVPQIWVGKTYVGGCDELYELDGAGKLDQLITA